MIVLQVRERGSDPQQIETTATSISVGRAPDQTIVLTASSVSRHHGEIYSEDGAYWYRDLRSTHGSFSCRNGNAVPVDTLRLVEGSELAIGTPHSVISVKRIEGAEGGSDRPADGDGRAAKAAPEERAATEATAALAVLIRLDGTLGKSPEADEDQLLGALLKAVSEVFLPLDSAAVLERGEQAVSVREFTLFGEETQLQIRPAIFEMLADLGQGFLFRARGDVVVRAGTGDTVPPPVGGGNDETTGICVSLNAGEPYMRCLVVERALSQGPFRPKDLDITHSLALRVVERLRILRLTEENLLLRKHQPETEQVNNEDAPRTARE